MKLLLAAALLATPALVLSGCSGDAAARDGGAPAAGAPRPALSTETLLTDSETEYDSGADWFRTGSGEGDGQDAFNPCAAQSLTGTGATTVVRADYELRNSGAGAPEVTGDYLVEVVGQYDDEAAATRAWTTINGWLEECAARPADLTSYRTLQTRKVAIPETDAVITEAHVGPVPKEVDPNGDAAYLVETGVVRKGDRVVVLTSVVVGQDYDFLGGTPVERMLPKAAARL
ncbi:hypothetical protein GCM10022237_29520 [Nocardioides ginsengisoli]|uniref:Uncharacterized protein n=1 Tax=Nocardioides ginsengisoli TaxID=363868 RepID=A0ABW3VVK1_9ACTN